MTQLLVSVRSVAEAEAAIAGGAGIIDIKEPSRGSLGRADDDVVLAIVRFVDGRRPVSMALGELLEKPRWPAEFPGLVKVGFAGCGCLRERAAGFMPAEGPPGQARRLATHVVLVAYADGSLANSPPVEDVAEWAIEMKSPAFLIDTWTKDGRTLLDWMLLDRLARLCATMQDARVPIALAGSLRQTEILRLLPLCPDIIAVRGVACRKGRRTDEIDAEAVRRLAGLVKTNAETRGSSRFGRKATETLPEETIRPRCRVWQDPANPNLPAPSRT